MEAWAWIVKAAQDIYNLIYTEIGRALSVLKDSTGKYSSKRIAGILLIINGIYGLRLKTNWVWVDLFVGGGQIIVGAVLLIVAALTKS
jgi:hypothetical protein